MGSSLSAPPQPSSIPVSEAAHVYQECIVCFDSPGNWKFGPCGHKVLCEICSIHIVLCPICHSSNKDPQRMYDM